MSQWSQSLPESDHPGCITPDETTSVSTLGWHVKREDEADSPHRPRPNPSKLNRTPSLRKSWNSSCCRSSTMGKLSLQRSWGAVLLPMLLVARTAAAFEDLEEGYIGRHLLQDPTAAVARVFRGQAVPSGKYPFMVSLRMASKSRKHFCGGCLVAPDVVVTAAHCVDEHVDTFGVPNPIVLIGAVQVGGDAFSEEREVCNTIVHSKWSGNARLGFDIALLILSKPSTKRPIPVSKLSTLPLGDPLTALGWGLTAKGLAAELQEVLTLEVVSQSTCDSAWRKFSILPSMVCADGPAGEDTCSGDSGGPLVHNGELVGVTSFGTRQCGLVGIPGVYTGLASFAEWIDSRGADESKEIGLPFCGAKAGNAVSQKDKLSALISNTKIQEAATLLGDLIASGDLGSVVESVVEVSVAGRAEVAVNVILQAAKDGVSEDSLISALNQATKQLPDKNKPISSGAAVEERSFNRILPLIQAGDVDGAAAQVANAIRAEDSNAVVEAIGQTIADENRSAVSSVLVAAIRDHGVDPAELATILSPLCRDDDACSSFLIQLANSQ